MTNEEAHRLAREKGVSRVLYALIRGIVVPFMRLWFRLRIDGAEHIPKDGAAIVVPNHKSFWDSFFVAAATKRHLRYMGKSELFEGPWGRLLIRLGAFPVRRGQADEAALETAREILRQDGLLAMSPEGTASVERAFRWDSMASHVLSMITLRPSGACRKATPSGSRLATSARNMATCMISRVSRREGLPGSVT